MRFARLLRWGSLCLLAPRCLVCAEAGIDGLDLCRHCRSDLPWNEGACLRCALPLAAGADCPRCLADAPPFARAHAAFRYEFPVDRLLPRFKFHADLAAGALLATLLHWSLDPAQWPQALLPVPLHRSRLRLHACAACVAPRRRPSSARLHAGAMSPAPSRWRPVHPCPRTWRWSTTCSPPAPPPANARTCCSTPASSASTCGRWPARPDRVSARRG